MMTMMLMVGCHAVPADDRREALHPVQAHRHAVLVEEVGWRRTLGRFRRTTHPLTCGDAWQLALRGTGFEREEGETAYAPSQTPELL